MHFRSPSLSRFLARPAVLLVFAVSVALSSTIAVPNAASTYYVAPNGLSSNDGSLARPLDLVTALSSQGPVRPGDTVWLRGGVYRRTASPDSHGDLFTFVSTLTGTAAAPIIVRQYPGERATLDGNLSPASPVLGIFGSYTYYWGFEVTNSNTNRSVSRGDGIDTYGHHNKLINLVIHDAGQGVGFWSTSVADDSEIYGSLISHVGWEGGDRGHGHSIYVQNANGTKRITDNILFESFSFGVHAYTSNGRIDNIAVSGNILFNHGIVSASGPKANILFAGDQVAQSPTVSGNYAYYALGSNGRDVDVSGCNNGRIQNNYLAGGTPLLNLTCSNTVVSGNTTFGPVSPSIVSAYPSNTYGTTPSGVTVGVRPNAYEPGRANVVVYNWAQTPTVAVNLAGAGLSAGDTIEVRDAQNFFGPAVFSGPYTGQVVLPMTGLSAAPVIGNAPIQPGHTSAQFGAFVVQRVSGGTTPSQPTASLTASPSTITAGASATLSWTTSGASSVSIDQGIGAVAASGSRSVAPGTTTTYTLSATNTAGTVVSTAVVTVQAAANVPPTVSLTAPASGSVHTQGTSVTLTAAATDSDGSVARVDFYADGQLVGSDTTSPYGATWTAGVPGNHSLTAAAVDNKNATTISTSVPVSVVAPTTPGGAVNVALAANGATATASSTYSTDYAPRAAIDGRRSGAVRGQLGTWEDANGSLPDWFQVTFAAPATIGQINVFSMQEAWSAPVEPTATLASYLAAEDFQLQYLNGTTWTAIPGGQVVGNKLVWRAVTFTPITTSAIRVNVSKVAGGYTRLTEVEAWTAGSGANPPAPPPPANVPPSVSLTAPASGSVATQGAAVALTATASDSDGTVARVEFYADGQLIATDTSSPYAATWTAGAPGAHSLTAVAVDNLNASNTSAAVPVTVVSATQPGTRTNVALASRGATATASSTYTTDYAPRAAIDGRRSGATRGQLGTWEDSNGAVPDWFQVSFAAAATINQVNVFSMQESWAAPIEPTATLTSYLAAEDFQVQYWNGATWVTVPGGQIVGNKLVWRQVTFTPVTTTAIRIVVSKVAGGYTRLTEVEAWTAQ